MVQALVMAGARTPDHHGSHQRLVWPAGGPVPRAKVDAIIVPTTRPIAYLKEAARAALHQGCPLVTLHSGKWTCASDADRSVDPRVDLIAIDVPEPAQLRLPELETSRLLAGTVFEQRSDLSAKRNLGLMLSHMHGWERVVFLDDDIRVPDPDDLSKATGLLDTHAAVGLRIGGFPDNSVVCHAFRDAGGDQGTFVGGGAMAVAVQRNRSYFPNIYNEDWFYLLDAGKRLQSVATVGEVLQYPYDPYRANRARGQELGDVLAEGIFWLLDQGKTVPDGDLEHWGDFLARRRRFIGQVLGMIERSADIGSAERARMVEALKAALGRLALITPELCVAYLKALITDQERWQRHIQGVQRQPRERALKSLARRGGTPLTWYTRQATSAPDSRRRPRVTPAPRWRKPRRDELQASIQAPPRALISPGMSVAGGSPDAAGPGVSASHAAHAAIAAKIALACQQRHADGGGQDDKRPSQPLHP
jgi:hypothetical protein